MLDKCQYQVLLFPFILEPNQLCDILNITRVWHVSRKKVTICKCVSKKGNPSNSQSKCQMALWSLVIWNSIFVWWHTWQQPDEHHCVTRVWHRWQAGHLQWCAQVGESKWLRGQKSGGSLQPCTPRETPEKNTSWHHDTIAGQIVPLLRQLKMWHFQQCQLCQWQCPVSSRICSPRSWSSSRCLMCLGWWRSLMFLRRGNCQMLSLRLLKCNLMLGVSWWAGCRLGRKRWILKMLWKWQLYSK